MILRTTATAETRTLRNVALSSALMLTPSCYQGIDLPVAEAGGSSGDSNGIGDSDNDSDGDSDGDSGSSDDEPEESFEPPAPSMRILLPRQYENSVRDLLGSAAAAVVEPPYMNAISGFESIAAAQVALGDAQISAYETSARAVANLVVDDSSALDAYLDCTPAGPQDDACMRSFVLRFGRMAHRRSLSASQADAYTELGLQSAANLDSFAGGLGEIVAVMLQSPYFLYKIELGEIDPDQPRLRRLTGYEVATRLSFFLVDTTPNDELLTLAEAGALDDGAGIREAATNLLATGNAEPALAAFFAEYYQLRELGLLPKDPDVFPAYDLALGESMQAETQALISELVWNKNADFRELFDAPYTFVDADLAALYGVQAPPAGEMEKVTLPAEQMRAGLFGHASIATVMATQRRTSPTLRGKFVRSHVLCQAIPPPPPGTDTSVPTGDYDTMRERLEAHVSDAACNGCHTLMDPIGFGLEQYDGIGVFRTIENGVLIDASGEVTGIDKDGTFEGAAGLGRVLRDQRAVTDCVVRQLFRHATGHLEIPGEEPALDNIFAAFEDSGYRVQDMLVDLVASPAFRFVGPIEG